MLLTISTTHTPATDLGYLLHKHPVRVQQFNLSIGQAHVFYPQADPTRCTPGEDLASLAAIQGLEGVTTFMAAVGFGAELRDGIAHAQALRAVSRLAAAGGFLGCSSLLPSTAAGRAYLSAHDFVAANQEGLRGSHIHKVIRSAMEGQFGFEGTHLDLSPLQPLLVFFFAGGR